MTALYRDISRFFLSLRHFFFLPVLLLIGNFHQALDKYEADWKQEPNFAFLYEPVVKFSPEYSEFMEHEIDHLLRRRGFNGSVMVAHKGKAVYNKSFGYSHRPARIVFRESDNIFQLASVGKQFTAISTLMLYEKGLIGLDDPVHLYIDGFPYENITIRHLLNHTSGLQNYMYLFDHFWREDCLPGFDDMLNMMVRRNLPLNFTPGRRFSYSNTGYAFLAMLIEKVSGDTFSGFLSQNIFEPLSMKNSFAFEPSVNISHEQTRGLAAGHEYNGRFSRVIPVDHVDGITGDKGIFSTTEDLLKWNNALDMNLLVSEETLQMAFERGRLRSGYALNYGFGFRLQRQGNEDIAYHNGWWRGFRTAYVRLPENTLIVILNNTNASINGLDRQIQNIMNRSPYPKFTDKDELLASN